MKRWAAGLAALTVSFAVVGQQKTDPAPNSKSHPKLDSLRSSLDKIKSAKAEINRKLSTTRSQVRKVKGDLREIDGRLGSLENALSATTANLERSRAEQARLAEELSITSRRLEEKREEVRRRLRWMYVHENQSVVSAMVSAKDVSEFASRTYLMKRVAQADRKLFDEFARLRDEVEAKKQRQDQLVVEIAALKRSQESQQEELKGVREDKASVLGNLRRQELDLERLIAQLDAEEDAIEAQIAQYYRGAGQTSGLQPFKGRFSRPVYGGITSGFGMRFHPILRRQRMHNGLDFAAGYGAPILAAADGIVITATYTQGYGNMVILDHGGGISTLYGHASKILVREGMRVQRGERIALVGATGLATGPHLHWEVRVNGKPVNPATWL